MMIQKPRRARLLTGGSLIALVMGQGLPAFAQDQEEDDDVSVLQQVIVTSNKRAASIQDVPFAITVQTGEFIKDVRLNDIKDLVTFTPGVTGNSQDSFIDTLSIRGIQTNDFGVGGDPSISIYKDGLYQGRNGAVVTSLFDIDRAEVLRGPQNFLFGRSSIGGAISVVTQKPILGETGGYVELEAGSRGRVIGEGAINIPVGENLAFRLAAYGNHENGFVDNFALPDESELLFQEKYAFRASGLYEKGPLSVQATVEYEDRDQSGTVYQATGLDESFGILETLTGQSITSTGRTTNSDLALGNFDEAEVLSLGLQVDFDLGWATLTSLTGYKDHEFDYAEDFDGTSLAINAYSQDQEGSYFEQEVRLVSQGDGPFQWYAGASYYDENIDADFAQQIDEEVFCAFYYFQYYGGSNFGTCLADEYGATAVPEGLLETNQAEGRYDGWSIYVDATYEFTPKFDIGVGLRYIRDNRNFALNAPEPTSELGPAFALGFTTDGFLEGDESFDDFTPRFIARYRPTDDWSLFASVTRGFKAGGFGSFSISPDQPFGTVGVTQDVAGPDSFGSEEVWSYEVGTKATVLNGRVTFDANAYFYQYEDLQLTVPGSGGAILVENVGEAEGFGFEGSVIMQLTDFLDLTMNGAYTNTEINDAQAVCDGTDLCEGAELFYVPEFAGAAILNFHTPLGNGEMVASAELFGQTETFGGFLQLEEARQGGYADVSLTLGYKSDNNWSIVGYVENVGEELYFDGSAEAAGIIPAHFFGPSRPRTFGVRLSYDFSR